MGDNLVIECQLWRIGHVHFFKNSKAYVFNGILILKMVLL